MSLSLSLRRTNKRLFIISVKVAFRSASPMMHEEGPPAGDKDGRPAPDSTGGGSRGAVRPDHRA